VCRHVGSTQRALHSFDIDVGSIDDSRLAHKTFVRSLLPKGISPSMMPLHGLPLLRHERLVMVI
jgi:hypothetical protein